MKAIIKLTVDWEPSEVSNSDFIIEDIDDLDSYLQASISSNAQWDKVNLKIIDMEIKEDDHA